MRGQVAPRAPDGLSDTPGPFGKIIIILNGLGVSVSLMWRQMVVDEDAEAVSGQSAGFSVGVEEEPAIPGHGRARRSQFGCGCRALGRDGSCGF